MSSIFDRRKLDSYGTRTQDYISAEPFPHIVIDGLLREPALDQLIEEFPEPAADVWKRKTNRTTASKQHLSDESLMPSIARSVLRDFNSPLFVDFLQRLTGISGLIPDIWLEGGGLHQTCAGGFLKIHVDFNFHPLWKLDRRINTLLFLNKEWEPEWGGQLELWSPDMIGCIRSIDPIANRCVIFSTTEKSYHGHPDPLSCPRGITRKSIALYYYSNGRPEEETVPAHTTAYRDRPGEEVSVAPSLKPVSTRKKIKKLLRQLTS